MIGLSVPKLRFPEFSGEWIRQKLETKGKFFSGGTPLTTNKEFYNGDIPFIKSGEIDKINTEQSITKKGLKNSSAKMVKKGDLLFALYGATSGEVAISKIDGAINQAVLNIETNSNNIFLYNYFLKEKARIKQTYLQGGQGNLSAKLVKSLKFNFPSITEQNKISSFLSKVDEKIDLLEKKQELWETYKKGMMQQIFSQKLRFKDENGEDYPDWEEKRLGDIGTTYTGLSGKTKEDFGNGYPFITYKSIFDKNIIELDRVEFVDVKSSEKQNTVKYGDLFFTTSSETAEEVGMASVLLDKIEGCYLNSFCFGFRLNSFENTSPEFMSFYLRSPFIRKEIKKLAQGSTRFNLSKKEMMKLKLEIPSIQEQLKIANLLSNIDLKLYFMVKNIEDSKVFKKGLLQQMFC